MSGQHLPPCMDPSTTLTQGCEFLHALTKWQDWCTGSIFLQQPWLVVFILWHNWPGHRWQVKIALYQAGLAWVIACRSGRLVCGGRKNATLVSKSSHKFPYEFCPDSVVFLGKAQCGWVILMTRPFIAMSPHSKPKLLNLALRWPGAHWAHTLTPSQALVWYTHGLRLALCCLVLYFHCGQFTFSYM